MVAEAGPVRLLEGEALDPLVQPQCSLSVQLRRATGSIVGRSTELQVIEQGIREATTRLTAVTLEGEPGIGKTRLLVAAAEMAEAAGFTTVAITADEEFRGPFLVARSLFGNGAVRELAMGTRAESPVRRVGEALAGRDEQGFEHLSPDAKLLRTFDLAGVAIQELAAVRPIALLLDDAQWADDDTLRMLRYAVRSVGDRPVFLFLTFRVDELAKNTEATNFLADMERMGLVRRLRVTRFVATETGLLLQQVLGGPVDGQSVAAMHAQSEGVPFIVEELAQAHREAGTLQQVGGEWRLGRNAARLVPSAVRTLISRRAARLPGPALALLGEAAVLGRSFSVRDLVSIGASPGAASAADIDRSPDGIAAALLPAVDAGLLLPHPQGDAADYTFSHEQVRDFANSQLSNARRREVHGRVVDLLLESGEPPAEGLPMLAQHALAAGDNVRAARFSIDAAAAALRSNAPEEALRLVDAALPVVSSPADRRALLCTRDDAYAALRRTSDRIEGLAELGALAEALREPALELDVLLRRAAAFRAAHDEDAAAELARRVMARAATLGDHPTELRANLELGQALSRTELGDSFGVSTVEVDAEGAEAAFRRAIELAEQLGDERSLAVALREVGSLVIARLRSVFVRDIVQTGEWMAVSRRLQAGETLEDVVGDMPLGKLVGEAGALLERALAAFERLDDRSGVMSTVIAMAYLRYAPLIHLSSSVQHLEEIKRVIARQAVMVTESERAAQELHLLYGIHVYGLGKMLPDAAISRGEEAYRAARLLGRQDVQFSAARGVALAYLQIGDVAAAERWIDTAAEVSSAVPTPARTRQLALIRGRARAVAGDVAGMRTQLQRAVELASGQGRAAARCESLTWLAVDAARLGAERQDDDLLDLAERSATAAKDLVAQLPGRPQWGPECDAALATVQLARGNVADAVGTAFGAVQALEAGQHEDVYPDVVLPAGRILLEAGPPEAQEFVRGYLQLTLARCVQGMLDEDIRVRWLRGPIGARFVALAGEPVTSAADAGSAGASAALSADDRALVVLMTEGLTNREIAARLELDEATVTTRLAQVMVSMGATDRAHATTLAMRGLGATLPSGGGQGLAPGAAG